jgi:hypothetical protein
MDFIPATRYPMKQMKGRDLIKIPSKSSAHVHYISNIKLPPLKHMDIIVNHVVPKFCFALKSSFSDE